MTIARLFVTHVWCPEIEAEFLRCAECPEADTWLLLDSRINDLPEIQRRYPRHHLFDLDSLAQLPYRMIHRDSLMGHGHGPVLDFFLTHPNYDCYWFIEYDVRYTGQWSSFFARYNASDADFITTHIRRYAEEPQWPWWPSFRHPAIHIPTEQWLRSFNVIYRISKAALQFLDQVLREGWRGHHEVLVATLLNQNGFKLQDFGGNGDFVDPCQRNVVYTSQGTKSGYLSLLGTVRFRPSRATEGSRANMLYHPVKPAAMLEPANERRYEYRRWKREYQSELMMTETHARR